MAAAKLVSRYFCLLLSTVLTTVLAITVAVPIAAAVAVSLFHSNLTAGTCARGACARINLVSGSERASLQQMVGVRSNSVWHSYLPPAPNKTARSCRIMSCCLCTFLLMWHRRSQRVVPSQQRQSYYEYCSDLQRARRRCHGESER